MQAENSLSRRTDHKEGVNLHNQDQILLIPEYFAIRAVEAFHKTPINDNQILKEVKVALLSDKVTINYKSLLDSGLREFEKSLAGTLKTDYFFIEEKCTFRSQRMNIYDSA